MKTERYVVRSKNGWELEFFDQIDMALEYIDNQEKIKDATGEYEMDFYEIYDSEKGEVVWP